MRVKTEMKPGRHSDGGGLYLSVSPAGTKRWVFMYGFRGRQIEMGLGSARDVPLARARVLAAEARAHKAEGRSPLDVKRKAQGAAVPTFGAAADDLIAALKPGWRSPVKMGDSWKLSFETYAAPIRGKSVDQVSTEDVLSILRPIWKTKPETANRVRSRIERVLDAARAKGLRHGENPARWRGHLALLMHERERLSRGHHAAMPWGDVPAFCEKLRASHGVSARALEFTILTAARTGETIEARWKEIDPAERVWTRPADRMKMGRAHSVPLVDRAIEILEEMTALRDAKSEFIFPGQRPGRGLSNMAMLSMLEKLGGSEFTVHGFRSSFRDWAGDNTAFPRDLAEHALAHRVGDETEQAYRRSDALKRRRKLMEAWERFLGRPAAAGANVVAIGKGRAG